MVTIIREYGSLVPGHADVSDAPLRDPDDRMILSAVLESRAHVLVSSDNDLLVLGTFRGAEIVTPRQFLDRFLPSNEQP